MLEKPENNRENDNDSQKNVKAYWFFTPKTIPDKEMLKLLDNDKHDMRYYLMLIIDEKEDYLSIKEV